jgi:CubicO group peptidase (beta-lactamase class C family)
MTATTVHSRVTQARARLRVPALGAGVVDSDGRLELHVAGPRRRGHDDPATDADRWHIGSCGKSMTAALYARLVEAGRARWAAPLTDLFGDVRAHRAWASVTMDDLLLHRSGAPATIAGRRLLAYARDTRPPAEQRTQLATEILAAAPVGVGRFRYSNVGYALAGAAIERIVGEPFESALHTYLLAPLGIATAGFGPPPDLLGHRGRLRVGSLILGRGPAVDRDDMDADNPAVIAPAGRLHLTIADWSRFQRLFLAGSDLGLLRPESIDKLLTVEPGDRYAMGWAPAQGLGIASFGQQGSNTYWVATALLRQDRRRSAMVVVNDGRTTMFTHTARLAAQLLETGEARRPQ